MNRITQSITILVFSLTIISLIGQVQTKQWFHDVKATALTPQTFQDLVGKENHVMIEFFTPWCMYCQQMMGEWNRLFSYFEEQPETRKDVKICKMNCEEHQPFCGELGIRQFPTIKLFIAGSKDQVHQFQGNRRFEDFNHFLNHHISPKQAQQEDEMMQRQQQLIQQQQQQQQQQLIQQQIQQQQQEAIQKARLDEAKRQQEYAKQREEEIKNLEEIQKRQKASEQQHQDELKRIQELEKEITQRQEKQQNNSQNNNQQGGNNSIQSSLQQLDQRITMLSKSIEKIERVNINTDYVNSKLEIVLEEQKILMQQVNRILDAQGNIHKNIQKDEKINESGKEQLNNNNQLGNKVQSSQFSILPAILFLLAGTALGYLFFVLRANKKEKHSTLLVSQHSQEMHKAN